MKPTMTREEFEYDQARGRGRTVEWLHANGRYAEACRCDDPDCVGWALGWAWEDAILEDEERDEVA